MDQHTLIISCVEYYSCAKDLPAPLAFRSFEETDLMPLLLDSQKQFPQMQLDFFLGIIDGVLTLGSQKAGGNFQADEQRVAKIGEVVSLLMKMHKMDALQACRMYYSSQAAKALDAGEAGMQAKSVEQLVDLIEAEK